MPLTITHATVATAADDPEAEINKDEWNEAHVLTGDYLRKATVTLSSAQILDLHNTPVTLVAAPGAGKWVQVHKVAGFNKYGTAAYAVPDDLNVVYEMGGSAITSLGSVINGRAYDYHQTADLASGVGNDTMNDSVVAKVVGGAITDGDGTLTVTVWYSIEDVPA